MLPYPHRCTDPLIYSRSGHSKRIGVFIDRDGTLIEEKHYLHRISDMKFLPGIVSGLRKLTSIGMSLYLFTNQAGIAHGHFDEATLAAIHHHLLRQLRAVGIGFRGLLYCPHHPEAEISTYRCDCGGRKPKADLLFQAALYDRVNLAKSFVIGDKLGDIVAGKKAGTKTILVLTGYGRQEAANIAENSLPDYIAPNLAAAIHWVISQSRCGPDNPLRGENLVDKIADPQDIGSCTRKNKQYLR
jgi:D-glycero-D-manno-heptose 1,7-bisphosphate phosphatase